jgi:hypothetical protein
VVAAHEISHGLGLASRLKAYRFKNGTIAFVAPTIKYNTENNTSEFYPFTVFESLLFGSVEYTKIRSMFGTFGSRKGTELDFLKAFRMNYTLCEASITLYNMLKSNPLLRLSSGDVIYLHRTKEFDTRDMGHLTNMYLDTEDSLMTFSSKFGSKQDSVYGPVTRTIMKDLGYRVGDGRGLELTQLKKVYSMRML